MRTFAFLILAVAAPALMISNLDGGDKKEEKIITTKSGLKYVDQKIGDGKIFLPRVDEAIRIRNDERGESAL